MVTMKKTGNQDSSHTPCWNRWVNGALRVHVVPGRAPLLLSKEFLRHLGSHIDLFFEKLGVRTVATSKQSPHLLLPLTSFGPQGHKISHASVQTNVQSTVPRVTVRDWTKYIRGSSPHLTIKHLKPTAPTLNPCMERMDTRKIPVMKRETTGKQRRKMSESAQYRQANTIRPNARRTAFLP